MKVRPKFIVMDTMNFWMELGNAKVERSIGKIDALLVNDSEARELSGEFSLVKAARKIMQMGPKYLIIKKGEHGALLFHENLVFFAPALPLEEVFDPTGAGDTFAGGFIGHHCPYKRSFVRKYENGHHCWLGNGFVLCGASLVQTD